MNREIKLRLQCFLKKSDDLGRESQLTETDIKLVEKELGVVFSSAFRELNAILRYDYLSAFEFLNFQTPYGVIEETLKLREFCNLPESYVVLTIEDDVRAVLLETVSNVNKENRVIFCTLYDLQNVNENGVMVEDPTIFPTFTDFFSYLLDQEEKLRAEEKTK